MYQTFYTNEEDIKEIDRFFMWIKKLENSLKALERFKGKVSRNKIRRMRRAIQTACEECWKVLEELNK